ncbi:MAG: T9SS type A sorting domain-containing protein [Candidatus Poribacteria bacterium]
MKTRKKLYRFLIFIFIQTFLYISQIFNYTNAQTWPDSPPSNPPSTITYNLYYGWNCISCPGDPLITSWATIKSENSNILLVVEYDPTQQKYIAVNNIEFGKSYFLGVISDTKISLQYYPRTSLTRVARYGWNSLGSLPCNIPKSSIISDPSGSLLLVVRYNNSANRYEAASTIETGIGYMAGCINDCTLNMSCPSPAPPINQKNSANSELKNIDTIPLPPDIFGNMSSKQIMENSNSDLIISAKSKMNIPDKTKLLANYPNPCNPETWIPYQLSIDTKAKVMIYSLNGDLVRVLDLGYKSAGKYIDQSKAVYWDGKNELGETVSSGIYYYTLLTDNFSQTRKLVIKR